MKQNLNELIWETKVLRDPVHGYIHIRYQIIWDLLNTAEFQRLRRIHQLGGVCQVYHTAEHTRFAHSLGVYELARRMIDEIPSIQAALDEEEQIMVLCAALLHDIGHGPFSHFYERLTGISHEKLGWQVISNPETEICQVLMARDSDLPDRICRILSDRWPKKLVCSMISSQLDADRMDYLLRDAYETGTSYGKYDLERILRTLRAADDALAVKISGIHAVEDYIMARYQMYFQVYQHPDAYGYELLIERYFQRLKDLKEIGKSEIKFEPNSELISLFEDFDRLQNPEQMIENGDFTELDEIFLFTLIRRGRQSEDPVLMDLSDRILNRKLPSWTDSPDDQEKKRIFRMMEKQGLDRRYYSDSLIPGIKEYLPYQEKEHPIPVLENGRLKKLSDVSDIAGVLLQVNRPKKERIYYSCSEQPDEISQRNNEAG